MTSNSEPTSPDARAQLFHDILNHLHTIGLGLEALKTFREDPDEFEALCESINNERKKSSELVRQLRDMKRPDSDTRR